MVSYESDELELFKDAENWSRYLVAQIAPHLRDRVIEVGAGIGTRTQSLCRFATEWIALDPDAEQIHQIEEKQRKGEILPHVHAVVGDLSEQSTDVLADSIIYVDVLEHIEDDAAELDLALRHLKVGGRLVVLSPAHQWLYSEFDKSIGHFRRYNAESLRALAPIGAEEIQMRMLDSAGVLASSLNKFFLKNEMPTSKQIALWDKGLVRVSRRIDSLLGYKVGKSILAVWERRY